MEISSISYGTYKIMFVRGSISFTAMIGLIKEFWLYQPLSSVLAMIWIILSATFVIVFPTLTSAMSGYSANDQAFILDNSGNYLAYANLYLVDYVIHDKRLLNITDYHGTLHNLTSPYLVKRPKSSLAFCVVPIRT
jgi:hypothetical protein